MLPQEARLPHSVFAGARGRRVSFQYGSVTLFPVMPARVAIVVSKKTARRAVDRNKIRRRVAHALSPLRPHLIKSVVLYPSSAALRAKSADLRRALEEVLPTR